MAHEVDLRELRIFLVLAHELHFGRTAERLQISQARVSQAIQSLEVAMGGRLFERSSRRVALTATGRELLERAEPAVEHLQEAVDLVRQTTAGGISGVLRLGLPNPSSGGPDLMKIVRRFREQHAACEVQLVTQRMRDAPLQLLRSGEIDLAALRLPLEHPDLEVGPVLSREDRVLLVAADDPLATRSSIDYDEIGDRRVSQNRSLPNEMMAAFIPPVTSTGRILQRIHNSSVEQLMLRVALGEQVHPTVVSWLDHHPWPGVTAVPIRDLPASETALVKLRSRRSPVAAAFTEVASQVLAAPDARRLAAGSTESS